MVEPPCNSHPATEHLATLLKPLNKVWRRGVGVEDLSGAMQLKYLTNPSLPPHIYFRFLIICFLCYL